jgi:hypothetical protein
MENGGVKMERVHALLKEALGVLDGPWADLFDHPQSGDLHDLIEEVAVAVRTGLNADNRFRSIYETGFSNAWHRGEADR